MRSILRAGLGALLGVALVCSPALAIEYDDIFELNDKGVSVATLVQLIVDDGRAFDLSDEELDDLRAAGVSEIVIDAMIDPAVGRAWLDGDPVDDAEDYDSGGAAGYSTSLDEAYGQGYNEGRTALVYSFGYYYGPLARYYYADPFYYPFWYSGHSYSYWPSYYASWYRPAYSHYYAYPYNWYTYSSYYCHTYYDPGYWHSRGYDVAPGYGRTVWNDGPRWRDGGVTPPKGGRPDGSVVAPSKRLIDGQLLAGRGRGVNTPSLPRQIREATSDRASRPAIRTPGSRPAETRVGAGIGRRTTVERRVADRSATTVRRGSMRDVSSGVVRRAPAREVGRAPAIERRSQRGEAPGRSVGRGDAVRRSNGRADRPARRATSQVRAADEGRRPRERAEAPAPPPESRESRGEERRGEVRRDPPPPPAKEPAREEPARRDEDRSVRGVIGGMRGGR